MSLRKTRRSVLIAAGLGALTVSGLLASRVFARQMEHGGPTRDAAPRVFRRLARHLELSPDQQARIRSILKAHASEFETQVQAGMEARRALHDAVMAEPPDENAIRSLAERVGQVHADGAILFARIRGEVWPILSPEQQEKVQDLRAVKRSRGDRMLRSLDLWLRSDG